MRLRQNETIRQILLALVLLLFASVAFAVRRERLIDKWKPQHYTVSITLNRQLSEITSAQADIDIVAVKALGTVDLDFGDLKTDSVSIDGGPVMFKHKNGKLEIDFPTVVNAGSKLRVTVKYHGKPTDGLLLTNDKDGTATAVGDNWPDRVHHWIPSLDHPSAKATVTFNISAPTGNVVVANGRLTEVQKSDSGLKTWTFIEDRPIPPYCMIIAVGSFAQLEPSLTMLPPLEFFVPYSDRTYAQKGFSSADEAIQLLTEQVGPYPYEKLALIIGATRFGGMENSSAIVFTSTLFNQSLDAKTSKAFGIPTQIEKVVAHEIAHQWFGDSVTESTWSDLWLSEGFATYFSGLFVQKYDGEDAFQLFMKEAADSVFTYEKKTLIPIYDRDTEDLNKLLNANSYQKGAWVLHMLRSRLGDEAFFRGIRAYYNEHKNATATTEDLRIAFERASGQKLDTFFARWIYDSGHPQYALNWDWLPKEKSIKVSLEQTQAGNAFADPVPIVITTSSGKTNALLKPTAKTYSLVIRSTDQPTSIEVDPKRTLLKEVVVNGR